LTSGGGGNSDHFEKAPGTGLRKVFFDLEKEVTGTEITA
jgi:hypothetical protein